MGFDAGGERRGAGPGGGAGGRGPGVLTCRSCWSLLMRNCLRCSTEATAEMDRFEFCAERVRTHSVTRPHAHTLVSFCTAIPTQAHSLHQSITAVRIRGHARDGQVGPRWTGRSSAQRRWTHSPTRSPTQAACTSFPTQRNMLAVGPYDCRGWAEFRSVWIGLDCGAETQSPPSRPMPCTASPSAVSHLPDACTLLAYAHTRNPAPARPVRSSHTSRTAPPCAISHNRDACTLPNHGRWARLCMSRLSAGDQREHAGVQSKQAEEQAENRLHDAVQPLATDSKPGSRAI